nr:MAG TPA: holin family protein [Caudoviricetes sp.]
MEEFANLIFNYGGTVVLAALFIYIFVADRKDKKEEKENNTQVLKELSNSNNNIAESLNLLKTSIDNNTAEYRQHDDRAIQQFSNINEKLIRIEDKLGK